MRNSAYFRSAEAKTKLSYDARRLLEEEGFKKYPILTLLFINSALYENNVQFAEAYCVLRHTELCRTRSPEVRRS